MADTLLRLIVSIVRSANPISVASPKRKRVVLQRHLCHHQPVNACFLLAGVVYWSYCTSTTLLNRHSVANMSILDCIETIWIAYLCVCMCVCVLWNGR